MNMREKGFLSTTQPHLSAWARVVERAAQPIPLGWVFARMG
jgi:hypothetical protein